jgi:hypothetical protein
MVDEPRNRLTRFSRLAWVLALAICSGATALTVSLGGSAPAPPTATQPTATQPTATNGTHNAARHVVASGVTPSAASATPVAVAPPATNAALPALVAQVQASGIDPGSNWSWSVGNTSTYCGPISGAGTGCTYGEAGLEHTIFSGVPTLALVAHELANAETQNDAVPGLLHQVATAAAGTSWSPTDAVASCLVEHFMGFQDDAAGTWQCPPALAAVVAENIHDTY